MQVPSEKPKGPATNYRCVQALRAIAALLVVVQHSIAMWLDWIMHRTDMPHWTNGAGGVDIFFVISGFVMAISGPGLAGKANKARIFLWRRFTRIAPLYWAATTLKIITVKLHPGAARPLLKPWFIAASYLFIPAKNGRGLMCPVLDVGWTLNNEVFFYILFAIVLVLNVSPAVFLTPCLIAVALVGMMRPESWPDFTALASPIVLEFLFGVFLAQFVILGKLPGKRVAIVLLALGLTGVLLIPGPDPLWRFIGWGLPAAALVTGAVALEQPLGSRLPAWLLRIGDASYALYLCHTFILPLLAVCIRKMHLHGIPALLAAIVLGVGISVPIAVLIHRSVELPLMNLFKKRRTIPASKPAPLMAPAGSPLVTAE